jgi:RHS repeat-associated protein/uncharacterized repeat protein (TIGR01451 family)
MLLGLFGSPNPAQPGTAYADELPPKQPVPAYPAVDPQLPSLHVTVQVSPRVVSPGEVVTATVKVYNQAVNPASNLEVTLPLPEGAIPEVDPSQTGWTWQVPSLAGESGITETVTMRVTGIPTGAALVANVQATADDLPLPLESSGGAVVLPPGLGPTEVPFVPGQPATLRSQDGSVTVQVPADVATRTLTLRHGYRPRPGESEPPSKMAGFKGGFGNIYLNATDSQGSQVHRFSRPLTVTVQYTPEQLRALGIGEENLTLFWFDEDQGEGGRWVSLETQVDKTARKATARVDHFSTFQMSDGSSPSAAFLPSLQGWQVGLYTGNVSYQYPIEVPAGSAGMKPNITLSYNSTATDGTKGEFSRAKQQTGWVGKGWSLEPGYVGLNKIGSDYDSPRYYTLAFDGQSFDIVRSAQRAGLNCSDPNREPNRPCPDVINPTDWEWRTTDESFVKVQAEYNPENNGNSTDSKGGKRDYDNNGVWTPYKRYIWNMWTKSGVRYQFSSDAWQGWSGDVSNQNYMETYKWYLKEIRDTHGNTITYTYARTAQTVEYFGFHMKGVVDEDIWIDYVEWGANANTGAPNRYRADFTSIARPYDTNYDLENSQFTFGNAPHQTQRLQSITIQSNPTGSQWDTVGRYDFTYDFTPLTSDGHGCNGSTCTPSPDSTNKMALYSVQRFGKNGGALPATTFTYDRNIGSGWYANGAWNRLTGVNNGHGGTITFSYENISAAVSGQYGNIFKNNRRVISKVVQDGAGHTYTWTYSYTEPGDITRPAYNTLGTGFGDLGPNTKPNSAILYWAKYFNGDQSSKLVHKWREEFRGHRYGAETDPNGNVTEHWFYQGDARPEDTVQCNPTTTGTAIYNDACWLALEAREQKKGKEYKTVVHQGTTSGPKLSETTREYTVTPISRGLDGSDEPSGLWRYFSYENQTEDKAWDGGGTALTKTTTYTYDQNNYGNLTSVHEAEGASVVRKTDYQYITRNDSSAYIVDRRWSENIKNGQDEWLARTVYGYDGFNPNVALGTTGDLRQVRKFYNIPIGDGQRSTSFPATAYSSDTSYAYDSYGNQTTATTYAGNGTVTGLNGGLPSWGSMGGGSTARTTTTTYDPTFHAFPTQADQPALNLYGGGLVLSEYAGYDYRMGTMTSVTDANGQVTTAEYDEFGRMTKLRKPGDASPNTPTVQADYYDAEIPFRYLVSMKESNSAGASRPITKFYDGMGREIQVKAESQNGTQNIVTDKVYDGLGQVTQQSQAAYVSQSGTPFYSYVPLNDPARPYLRWTTTQYDALGRPTLLTAPDSTATQMTYSVSTADSLRSATTIDAKNHKTERRSDMFGRLKKVVEYSGNNGSEGAWQAYATTSYTYNPLDLLTNVQDAYNKNIWMAYDSLGRKTSMGDLTMGNWSYEYFVDGSLKKQTDAKLQDINFLYDELGRLRSKTYPGGAHSDYIYDGTGVPNGKGQRTKMERFDGSGALQAGTEWTYTARGQQASATYTLGGLTGTRAFSWEYDSGGRMTSVTYPGGEKVTYGYDPAWRQTSACSAPAPNGYNICYAQNATYTALDQPDYFWLGNNLAQDNTYSGTMQRLQQMVVGPGLGIYDKSYGYDAVGNVQSITNALPNPDHTQQFGYDHRDRLTSWTYPGIPAETYQYDLVGNLTNKAGASNTYNYAHASGSGGPYAVRNTGYSYDANGNMLGGSGRSYTWNAENLPATITSGGVTETYTYDAEGERAKKVRGSGTQPTYYAGGLYEEVPALGKGTSTTQRYYYTFAGQTVAQREKNLTTGAVTLTYLHSDHLGSVSASTSSSGSPLGQQEFDPWGQTRTALGGGAQVTQTTLNYTGQKRDDTGLLYYHARMYDPALGRFVSPDSIVPGASSGVGGAGGTVGQEENSRLTVDFHESGFLTSVAGENATTLRKGFWFQLGNNERRNNNPSGPSNPQAFNRYSYALSNPVRYTDPTGHCPVCLVAVPAVPVALVVALAASGVTAIAFLIWWSDENNRNSVINGIQGGLENIQSRWDAFVTAIKQNHPMVTVPSDPTQSPGEGWEWRGRGAIGSAQGSWYNPKTGESLHPDLGHPAPIGPHWDYIAPDGTRYRIFPDGRMEPKNEGGGAD